MNAPAAFKRSLAYFLKNIHAVSANKTIATTHRDESLISVFLAMREILTSTSHLLPDGGVAEDTNKK